MPDSTPSDPVESIISSLPQPSIPDSVPIPESHTTSTVDGDHSSVTTTNSNDGSVTIDSIEIHSHESVPVSSGAQGSGWQWNGYSTIDSPSGHSETYSWYDSSTGRGSSVTFSTDSTGETRSGEPSGGNGSSTGQPPVSDPVSGPPRE